MRVIRDSSIYVFGELFAKSIPFLLLPYLARELGAEGFGNLANAQAYIALCLLVLSLSQDGAVVRYFYRYGRRSIGLIVSNGAFFSSMLFLGISLYAFLMRDIFILYIACAGLTQTFLGVQLALRQCQKKPLDYVFLQIISGSLIALFSVLLIESVAPRFEYYVFSIIAANGITSLIGFLYAAGHAKSRVRFGWKVRKAGFVFILAYGLPMILHQSSFFLKGHFDRFLIINNHGAETLGIYAAGFQIASAFAIIVMAINKATVPYYYEGIKSRSIKLQQVFSWSRLALMFFWLPAIIAYTLPENWFAFVLGQQFSQAKYYAVMFLLGLGLNVPYLILVNFLFYQGDNSFIALASLSSAAIHVLLLFVLISLFPVIVVPVALLISNFVLLSLLALRCRLFDSSVDAANSDRVTTTI